MLYKNVKHNKKVNALAFKPTRQVHKNIKHNKRLHVSFDTGHLSKPTLKQRKIISGVLAYLL